MVSRYDIRRPLTGAYCITEEFLKDIHRLFEKTFQKQPTFTIKFRNNHQFVCESVSDLLSESAVRSEPIQSLSISSGWGNEFYAEMDFSSTLIRTVFLRVSGDRDPCIIFEREVLNELKSIKAIHSLLYSGPAIEGLSISVGSGLTVLLLIWVSSHEFQFLDYMFWTTFVMFWFSAIISFLFPKFEFDFGRGRTKAMLRKRVIYFVFVTILLGSFIAIFEDKVVKISGSFFEDNAPAPSTQKQD